MAANSTPTPGKLRLHLYDHCPYCIRVELVLGWHDVPYERVVYGYGDRLGDPNKADDPNCYDGGVVLTGKKELPVLESINLETNQREWLKAESLDIISWVLFDKKVNSFSFPQKSGREDLSKFFHTKGRFKVVQRILSRGRNLQMTHLKDWAKSEDRAYAKAKYEKGGFDYDAAQQADASGILEMQKLLEQADKELLKSNTSLNENGVFGFDDLLYLPELRTLSLVKGLVWPERLKNYVVTSFAKAETPTYFDHQIE